jgi:hypothetical protein
MAKHVNWANITLLDVLLDGFEKNEVMAAVNGGEMRERRWIPILLFALVAGATPSCGRTTPGLAIPFDAGGGGSGGVRDEAGGSPPALSTGGNTFAVVDGGTVSGATGGTGGSAEGIRGAAGAGSAVGGAGGAGGAGSAVGGAGGAVSGGSVGGETADCSCNRNQLCVIETGECVCPEGTFGEDCQPCSCEADRSCDPQTGSCLCPDGGYGPDCTRCDEAAGKMEGFMGDCIDDPCLVDGCGPGSVCEIIRFDNASCRCEGGWSGPECDRHWQPLKAPPFVRDAVVDSEGNGWFAMVRGLLYWDFQGTPADTSDDAFQLVSGWSAIVGLAIDSQGRKYLGSGGHIVRLDDGGTPLDLADDEEARITVPLDAGDAVHRLRIDDDERIWVVPRDSTAVYVLAEAGEFEEDQPRWFELFDAHTLLDATPENGGVWLATTDGLFFVDLGISLEDESDDTWVSFSDVPDLDGRTVNEVHVDDAGTKWFNTDHQVLKLETPTGPGSNSGHVWSTWTPSEAVRQVGNGRVLTTAGDGEAWLKSPQGSALRVTTAADGDMSVMEYHPKESRFFEDESFYGVEHVAMGPDGVFRLLMRGELYFLDVGGTPNDPSDDVWTAAAGLPPARPLLSSLEHPAGGLWLDAGGATGDAANCASFLYHYDRGAEKDGLDDVWTQVALPTGCANLGGVDDKGTTWVRSTPIGGTEKVAGGLTSGLDPGSVSAEDWVVYPLSTPDFYAGLITNDPEAVWLGRTRLDTGSQLSDKADDRTLELDDYWPRVLAADDGGFLWFGYSDSAWGDPAPPAVLRRWDDAGTPWDTTDDIWTDYSGSDEVGLRRISALVIDDFDRKWMWNETHSRLLRIVSFDDGGSPSNLEDDVWSSYGADDDLTGLTMTGFIVDEHSNLWIATNGGLGYLRINRDEF